MPSAMEVQSPKHQWIPSIPYVNQAHRSIYKNQNVKNFDLQGEM